MWTNKIIEFHVPTNVGNFLVVMQGGPFCLHVDMINPYFTMVTAFADPNDVEEMWEQGRIVHEDE